MSSKFKKSSKSLFLPSTLFVFSKDGPISIIVSGNIGYSQEVAIPGLLCQPSQPDEGLLPPELGGCALSVYSLGGTVGDFFGYWRWYEPLPLELKQASNCVHPDVLKAHSENSEDREKALMKYACKAVTIETVDTIKAGLERRHGFKYVKKKRVDEPTKNKRSLSISKKRQLGLYSLPRNTISYAEALPMHQLWLEYIKPFLPTTQVKPNVEQRLKFFKQEYIGAMIEVVRSKCPSLVGLRGIIIFETKFTFKIVCENDISKTIPKASCVFSVIIDKVCLTIFGNYFVIRPAERINKKIKQKILFDL